MLITPKIAEANRYDVLSPGDQPHSTSLEVRAQTPGPGFDASSAPLPIEEGEPPLVSVQILPVPNRRGRHRKEELYPFNSIKVARTVDGATEGESFFIPDRDYPKRHIAVARKRYGPGKTFETRTVLGGVRVWRRS